MKRIVLISCILILRLQADYVYPVKDIPSFSSSFGEFRTNHFHEGIDFRVYGKTGVPALALDDGYISRIRMFPSGYGKMLYLTLKDGRKALYAHNQGFVKGLTEIVEAEQEARGIYSVDITLPPDRYPVKAGDVIAYIGNSGTVAPHLHFEILDSLDQPINPLLTTLAGFFTDRIPPQIRKIFLIPLAASSRVNDLTGSCTFSQLPVNDTLQLYGNWGIEIEVKDRHDNYHNPINIYKKILVLDQDTIYHYQFDVLNRAERYQVHIDYNNESYTRTSAQHQRLYRFNARMEQDPENDGGIIRTSKLSPGLHSFCIIVSDIYGNTSTSRVWFYAQSHHRTPGITQWNSSSSTVRFQYTLPESITMRASFHDKITGKALAWNGCRSMMLNENQGLWKAEGVVPTRYSAGDRYLLHVEFINRHKRVVNQAYYPLSEIRPAATNTGKPTFKIIPSSHILTIDLTGQSPIRQTAAKLNETQSITGICRGLKSIRYLMDYSQLRNGTNSLWLESDNILIQWKNQLIDPFHSAILYSPDSLLEIRLSEKCATNRTAVFSYSFDPKSYSIPVGLIPCSQVYSFEPHYEIFASPLTIRIKSPLQEKVGLYRISGGRISYLGKDYNGQAYQGTYNRLSSFVLLKDTQKPSIRFLNLKKGKMKKNNVRIRIGISDVGSGLYDQGIECRLDQTKVIPEWDAVRKVLIYRPRHPLSVGKHTLSVSLTDPAGNSNSQQATFHVY
ncbi:MAG: M23 family metallopeptidase [Candidatus Delongbacteria bacterium]|nr:M23 family metallopeptidase [Candidatus Delongbacteria bacterium]